MDELGWDEDELDRKWGALDPTGRHAARVATQTLSRVGFTAVLLCSIVAVQPLLVDAAAIAEGDELPD